MYAHGGSGNHGCEAIVRSTVQILKKIGYENPILISSNPAEDAKYGLNQVCKIMKDKELYTKFSKTFLKAYWQLKVKKNFVPMDEFSYIKAFSKINPGDIALSIGGDNYCYADVKKYIMLHNMLRKRGAKTVLWGCSVEPEVIENEMVAADLRKYSLIVARESISFEALRKVNPNTILVSDPAFFLESENIDAGKEAVGINISPMAIKNEKENGVALNCYRKLIHYILNTTKMDVTLIPHVVWEDNDDRVPLQMLYHEFKHTGRVEMISDGSCEKIKGIIKNCRYFVGARTHSTIAAYSTGVPTIVLGYSVKARGIAKDIFGKEGDYVLPVQALNSEEALVNEFKKMISERENIENNLKEYMKFAETGLEKIKKAFQLLEDAENV